MSLIIGNPKIAPLPVAFENSHIAIASYTSNRPQHDIGNNFGLHIKVTPGCFYRLFLSFLIGDVPYLGSIIGPLALCCFSNVRLDANQRTLLEDLQLDMEPYLELGQPTQGKLGRL